MKRNITLSADQEMIENARRVARSENRTLNDAFREWLESYQARATEARNYQDLMQRLKHVRAGRRFSRDEMNER